LHYKFKKLKKAEKLKNSKVKSLKAQQHKSLKAQKLKSSPLSGTVRALKKSFQLHF
jgi:hypothetical protein